MTVWAHHMFTTGAVLLPFFSFMTFLIAVPTGVKFFNWVGTMWQGQLTFEPPMLFTIGFLSRSCSAASPASSWPRRRWTSRCRLLLRGRALPLRAGRHGAVRDVRRVLLLVAEDDRQDAEQPVGKIQFWFMFIGFHMTFLVQHWRASRAVPRAPPTTRLPGNVTTLNIISTVGSWMLALSILMFLWNVYVTWRHGGR
jgi:cytochrome c oxidase subunit 1